MKIPLVDLRAQYNSIKSEIDTALQEIINSSQFILGEPVEKFEQELAQLCRTQHAVGTSSGTSALFLALKAYGIGPGDEVITVPNSFIATVSSIIHVGATPVFVDVDKDTLLMDPSLIEKAITSKTRAILPVHLYGQVCEMDKILEIASKHNLFVIEDAAQAIDSEYKDRKIPLGDTAIFSFFPAKNLGAYGDAGAVVTKDKKIADMIRKLRNHGRISKYESDTLGYGARLDALHAAILRVKMKHIGRWSELRNKHAAVYSNLLQEVPGLKVPTVKTGNKHVFHLYVIESERREQLKKELNANGIGAEIHYPLPLHLQPALKYLGHKEGDFPVTENAAKKILSLPMYPELPEATLRQVVEAVKRALKIEAKQ
ncbi:MAG: DegT/DnrJ/EryC1/StrS family aminotransferase [Nanoarchaeota archaeon]